MKPNSLKLNPKEAKLIFNLRSRMTEVKNNFKNDFEDLACRACGLEEETQQHVLQCKVLKDPFNPSENLIEYESIKNGTVEDKLKIAKRYEENFQKLENFK